MGEHKVFLLEELGGHVAEGVVLSLELGTAFFSGGVHAKHDATVLISVSETPEQTVSLAVVVLVLEQMATVAPPSGLGNLVVEKSGRVTLSKLLEAEPLKRVRLLTLTPELLRGSLGVKLFHCVVPGLARVRVEVPLMVCVRGPVGDSEALEESTGLSIESYFTDSLKESMRVEVLRIDVVHNIRLLVEFIEVDVLNSHTYIISIRN